MSIADRIRAAGITLPVARPSNALFAPYTRHRDILTVSGQLPLQDGRPLWTGRVPEKVSVEDARSAARLCLAHVLSWVSAATNGDLDRVRSVIRLGGFVATSEGFWDAPGVINAASELVTTIFEDRGRHARIAIGVASLPFDAPVEIEASFALDDGHGA